MIIKTILIKTLNFFISIKYYLTSCKDSILKQKKFFGNFLLSFFTLPLSVGKAFTYKSKVYPNESSSENKFKLSSIYCIQLLSISNSLCVGYL